MMLTNSTWLVFTADAGIGHYKTFGLWAADNTVVLKTLIVWSF